MAESSASVLKLLTMQDEGKRPDTASLLRQRLERRFEISLFLLLTAGFATIAATGALDFISIVAVSTALLVRGWFLFRAQPIAIPEKLDVWFSLAYVGFIVCDYYLLSAHFVTAAVHLVLFSMVIKLFSIRRDRDYVYLAILAFLEVLSACILTVDTFFVPAFIVFLLFAVFTFASFEIRRSWKNSEQSGVPNGGRQDHAKRFTRSLSATTAALVAGVLLLASAMFFVLPRVTAGYLTKLSHGNQIESGFSEDVRLGQIGEIQQSSAVVMHIQIEGDRTGAHDLYWRGVSLAAFSGRQWFNPLQRRIAPDRAPGKYDLRGAEREWQSDLGESEAHGAGTLIRYRVLMEPIGTNVFFLVPTPVALDGNYSAVSVDAGGAIFNSDGERPIGTYTAVSDIDKPSPRELRASPDDYPARVSLTYLQLPHRLDPRIRQLAEDITRGAATPYDKARAIEQYLRTHYGYTLQLPATTPADPIANFLFERKEGHCEYFASAMAVMLRMVGIPSRLVNGFRGGEFNDLTDSYIIRARDAHSWVEAYFPGYGWATFDPTPAASAPPAYSRIGLYVDAMREFWREWIVNYDFGHQRSLSVSAVKSGSGFLDGLRQRLRELDISVILKAYNARNGIADSPRKWSVWILLVAALFLLVINAGRLRRSFVSYTVRRNPARSPASAATIWYMQMTAVVARRGWRKLPSQTPHEFVQAISDANLQRIVAEFTRHYCNARFGASAEDAGKLPGLLKEIQARRRD